jgi:hypothetical protein
VIPFLVRPHAVLLALLLGVAGDVKAVWTDKSAGLPWLEYIPSKDLGAGEWKTDVLEDHLGRLFVAGADVIHVFDGQSWRSFPAGNSYLRLAFGENGRIWAASNNEAGYIEEISPGEFQYHSLMSHLPVDQRLVGVAWGCALVGKVTYFFFRDEILRWDGTSLQVQPFPGASRLFPIRLGDEYWFHHLETGLYRLTEAGPHLEILAAELPATGVLGLARDAQGLLVASGVGLFRPGHPPQSASSESLNQYLTAHRLATFLPLPDGSYAIVTLNGGMIIASKAGEILRIVDDNNGLPSPTLNSLRTDASGHVWAAASNGLLQFEGAGQTTVFNSLNGLKGLVNKLTCLPDGRLMAMTIKGVFQLDADRPDGAAFRQLAPETSYDVLPGSRGLILLRFGGIDLLTDGQPLHSLVSLTGTGAFFGAPVRSRPGEFYIGESGGLFRLTIQPNGTVDHSFLAKPPDSAIAFHEDTSGQLWVGTLSRGAFIYQPSIGRFLPVLHPVTGKPLSGLTLTVPMGDEILLLNKDALLQARADGTELRVVQGVPPVDPLSVLPLPDGKKGALVAFKRQSVTGRSTESVGVLSFGQSGKAEWHELDLPALSTVGPGTMAFTS